MKTLLFSSVDEVLFRGLTTRFTFWFPQRFCFGLRVFDFHNADSLETIFWLLVDGVCELTECDGWLSKGFRSEPPNAGLLFFVLVLPGRDLHDETGLRTQWWGEKVVAFLTGAPAHSIIRGRRGKCNPISWCFPCTPRLSLIIEQFHARAARFGSCFICSHHGCLFPIEIIHLMGESTVTHLLLFLFQEWLLISFDDPNC